MANISINDVSINENAGTAVFTVSLSEASSSNVTFNFNTVDGTAKSSLFNREDFIATSGSGVITAGQLSTTIEVDLKDDIAIESNETFTVNLSNASGATITDGTAVATILENDGKNLSANLITFDFSGNGSGNNPAEYDIRNSFSFTDVGSGITLVATAREVLVNPATGAATSTVETRDVSQTTFGLGIAGASDLAGSDMTFANQIDGKGVNGANDGTGDYEELVISVFGGSNIKIETILFGNGNSDDDWTLDVGGVELISRNASTDPNNLSHDVSTFGAQGNEFVFGVLSNTSSDDYAVKAIQVSIVDDPTPPLLPTLSIADVSVDESAGTATFTAMLSKVASNTVTVDYATANGTAIASSDYTAKTGSLTFAVGQTSKIITVDINDDMMDEGNETFILNLSNVSGANLTDASATATILDNDSSSSIPSLSISDIVVNEGTGTATFTATLSQSASNTVTVDYATANGTAIASSDYTAKTGSLTFAVGQTSQVITIDITDDAIDEVNETFVLNLSNASGVNLADASATATILDNDSPSNPPNDSGFRLVGGRRRDRLTGSDFDDVLLGKGNRDVLRGSSGDDKLKGGSGNDKLVGGAGNNNLIGGGGNDKLVGGSGDSIYKSGKGNDVLVFGSGEDIAIFGKRDGANVVRRFDEKMDIFRFKGAASLRDLMIQDMNRDTLIIYGQTEVLIKGINANDLSRSNFDF